LFSGLYCVLLLYATLFGDLYCVFFAVADICQDCMTNRIQKEGEVNYYGAKMFVCKVTNEAGDVSEVPVVDAVAVDIPVSSNLHLPSIQNLPQKFFTEMMENRRVLGPF